MAVSVATARQRCATALAAVSGWSESTYLGDLWSTANMLGLSPHQRFAVSAPSTQPAGRRETQKTPRNRPGGSMVSTRLAVRWMWRVRSDAQVADYDAALDAEQILITAATTTAAGSDVRYVLASIQRNLRADGEAAFVDGTFQLDALHQIDWE